MPLETESLAIADVLLLRPKLYGDERGFFMEAWNQRDFDAAVGQRTEFVQDNHSRSSRDVLRGLHYQLNPAQGKLVRVAIGTIFDVAVDIRSSSPTFGRWVAAELSSDNKHQLWIPPGFAHGFYVTSDYADFQYKCTDVYHPASEVCLAWDDPTLAIDWPLPAGELPSLSEKDARGLAWDEIPLFD